MYNPTTQLIKKDQIFVIWFFLMNFLLTKHSEYPLKYKCNIIITYLTKLDDILLITTK